MLEHLFTCVICERDVVDYAIRNGRDKHLAPLCRSCEHHYGDRSPTAGAFMDRRLAVQVAALANALCNKAHCIEWGRRYG